MNMDDIRSMCNQILSMCDYVDYMKTLHDCNDCGIKDSCPNCPMPGQQVRINCADWESEK